MYSSTDIRACSRRPSRRVHQQHFFFFLSESSGSTSSTELDLLDGGAALGSTCAILVKISVTLWFVLACGGGERKGERRWGEQEGSVDGGVPRSP